MFIRADGNIIEAQPTFGWPAQLCGRLWLIQVDIRVLND
jgi:hypothetical protein